MPPAAALPRGSELIYDTVFGELQTLLMLKTHLAHEKAKSTLTREQLRAAAQGWDGDRMLAWRTPDQRTVVAHLSVWDSARDAREYFDALGHVLRARYPDARTGSASGTHGRSLCAWVPGAAGNAAPQRIYLEQWGDLVLHLEGLPSTLDDQGKETDRTAQRLREASFQTVKRIPFAEELGRREARLEAEQRQQK